MQSEVAILLFINGIMFGVVAAVLVMFRAKNMETALLTKKLHGELNDMVKGLGEAHNGFVEAQASIDRKLSEVNLELASIKERRSMQMRTGL